MQLKKIIKRANSSIQAYTQPDSYKDVFSTRSRVRNFAEKTCKNLFLLIFFFAKKCELRTGMPEIKKIKADPINEASRNAIPEEFQNNFELFIDFSAFSQRIW